MTNNTNIMSNNVNSNISLVKEAFGSMSSNALYLDGAYVGTVINLEENSFSFDHHGAGTRFDKSSASLQVALAVLQGLDLSNIENVFVSSVDADSVLSVVVFEHPEVVKDLEFVRFLQDISRIDNHGPAAVVPGEAMYKINFLFRAERGVEETTELLMSLAEKAWGMYQDKSLYETSPVRALPGTAIVLGITGEALYVEQGEVSFADVYRKGSFGLLVNESPKGGFKFTVGKLPFARVPSLKELFPLLSAKEEEGTWGGADSIGGSPFTGSSLDLEGVLTVIRDWLK